MKRIITSTLLLSALALFSACQKSEQQAPAKGESIVFTASFAPETKTVIDGKQSLWNKDEIRIFNGNHSEAQEYVTGAENAATAEFKIKNTEATFTGTSFIAVCPNSLATNAWWNSTEDKTINHLWLVNIQRAFEGTYDPLSHVAVAYTENHELSFKNACTLLKFTIQSDNIQEIWFESNDETKISGNFGFNTETNEIYTGNTEYTNFSHVAVKDGFAKGKTYYMTCIPAELKSGFTIKVVANIDGKNVNGENIVYNKSIDLRRNKIYDLGKIEYKERPAETRTFYLKASSWASDGAVIDAWIWGESITDMWIDFEKIGETTNFKAELPKGTTGIKLFRRSSTHTKNDFDEKNFWNTSGDLTISDANDCLTFNNHWDPDGKGWDAGNYSE